MSWKKDFRQKNAARELMRLKMMREARSRYVAFVSLVIFSWLIIVFFVLCCCIGCDALRGPAGATGAQGPQGLPGAPCTVTQNALVTTLSCPDGSSESIPSPTVVQFCAHEVPAYPSTFPESGVCINGQLWAVYSGNGGFGFLVPDGTYTSDGVGASCTFTVDGCEVTDEP